MAGMATVLELLEAVRDRLALEVGGGPGHLDERELEREPRVAALAHVVDGDREQIAETENRGLAQLVRLSAQAVPGLVGQRQRVGHLAHVLDEEDMPQVLEEVCDQPSEILALVGELLEEGERAGRVAVDDEVADPEQGLLLDGAQQLEYRLHGDLALGRGRKLVQSRDRVAEAAAGRAGDQREGCLRSLDALTLGDALQVAHDLGQPRARENECLAARADRREHLLELGRAEDEDEMGRRLLDQLQQGVEGRIGQLVRLVEDVDLVAALDRLQHDALADLADVVDPALGGRVHLDDVERSAGGDRLAGVARSVGVGRRPLRAVQRLREDARERRLPGPARAGEEVRLADVACCDRVLQRPDDRLLPDHVIESLRPVFTIERSHGGPTDCIDRLAPPMPALPASAQRPLCMRATPIEVVMASAQPKPDFDR